MSGTVAMPAQDELQVAVEALAELAELLRDLSAAIEAASDDAESVDEDGAGTGGRVVLAQAGSCHFRSAE
jgi:uncharacterized protein YukE